MQTKFLAGYRIATSDSERETAPSDLKSVLHEVFQSPFLVPFVWG